MIKNGEVEKGPVSYQNMKADLRTKSLPPQSFEKGIKSEQISELQR